VTLSLPPPSFNPSHRLILKKKKHQAESSSAFPSTSSIARIPNTKADRLRPRVPSKYSLSHLYHFQISIISRLHTHTHTVVVNGINELGQMHGNGQVQEQEWSLPPHIADVISMTNWRRIGLHSQMSMVGSSILLHSHPQPLPFLLLTGILMVLK
jgi:hypothetical protein